MTPKQEEALRDYLQEAIVPLIEQVLVKKLGQAMTFAAQEVVSPKRAWVDLTEAEIDENCLGDEAKVRSALQLLKEKNNG